MLVISEFSKVGLARNIKELYGEKKEIRIRFSKYLKSMSVPCKDKEGISGYQLSKKVSRNVEVRNI